MSTVRLVDAVSLAKRVENIDITIAGEEAKWSNAKSVVLREIADSPTHDLSALIKAAQAEAIKEFWQELQRTIITNNTEDGYMIFSIDWNCLLEDGNEIVKRMAGEG